MERTKFCLILLATLLFPLFFTKAVAAVLAPQQAYAESDVKRVIIISIDSMNNIFVFNEYENPDFLLTPNIGVLVKNGAAFTDAEAVMPTKTTVNHVTMVSGSYAERIGVAGNYVLDKTKKSIFFWRNYVFPWKRPELIIADTLFKAMEREDSEFTSAVVAGKNFVGRTIWADIQVAPGYISETARELGVKKFPEIQYWDAPDEWTMENVLLILEKVDPDIMLVNLAFLDPAQHCFGHGSMESWAALFWADYQVGKLLKYLIDSEKIDSTLIVLTADHGQSNAWDSINIGKILKNVGIKTEVVAEGPFAHIFLEDEVDLENAVVVLQDFEAVDGLWHGGGLDDIHIRTPYTGDIVVSLRPPYIVFSRVQEPFIGTHGGLQQRFVPLVFFGPNVKRGVLMETASLTDIVSTICAITYYPLPEGSQGVVLPIIDSSQKTAPEISPTIKTHRQYTVSYLSFLFLIFALSIFVPALFIQRQYGFLWMDITSKKITHLAAYILLTASVVLAMTGSLFSYVVNLYSVPGIQPDAFLVSMDFNMLGLSIVSISLSLIIIWYAPLGVQALVQRIRRRRIRIQVVPLSITLLIVSQLIYASLNLIIRIPSNVAFHVFVLFFFGGLGLSYLYRLVIINKYIEVNKKNSLLSTTMAGVLTGIFWFYFLMLLLFPNYLFEMGIVSIV